MVQVQNYGDGPTNNHTSQPQLNNNNNNEPATSSKLPIEKMNGLSAAVTEDIGQRSSSTDSNGFPVKVPLDIYLYMHSCIYMQ